MSGHPRQDSDYTERRRRGGDVDVGQPLLSGMNQRRVHQVFGKEPCLQLARTDDVRD